MFRDALLENVDVNQNRIGIARQIYEHFTRIALEGVPNLQAVPFARWVDVGPIVTAALGGVNGVDGVNSNMIV